jgi:hypothetical protein
MIHPRRAGFYFSDTRDRLFYLPHRCEKCLSRAKRKQSVSLSSSDLIYNSDMLSADMTHEEEEEEAANPVSESGSDSDSDSDSSASDSSSEESEDGHGGDSAARDNETIEALVKKALLREAGAKILAETEDQPVEEDIIVLDSEDKKCVCLWSLNHVYLFISCVL